MDWQTVGKWIQDNAGTGAALVGSLLTGNVPGAVAAGVAMVSSATGTSDPAKALEGLQTDPATIIKLKELANQNEADIRANLRDIHLAELADKQAEQETTAGVTKSGDNSQDEYVRHTRPLMARQSWYAAMGYVIVFEAAKALGLFTVGANVEFAIILGTPAAAYLGLRQIGKGIDSWKGAKA